MSPDPRPDAEQVEVVARLVWNPEDYGAYEPNERDRDHARVILNALSAAGIPVGPVAALDYAEKLLLSDGAVEAGGGGIYGPGPPPGQPWSRDVAVRLARCVITRAFQQARKEER